MLCSVRVAPPPLLLHDPWSCHLSFAVCGVPCVSVVQVFCFLESACSLMPAGDVLLHVSVISFQVQSVVLSSGANVSGILI